MHKLRFYLLGTLDLYHEGRQLPKPPTVKSQSLLAYLVLYRDRPQPRERLAGLFWGERPERKARRSLTTALWHIRRCLPEDEVLLCDARTVRFDPQAALWIDSEEFETLASGAGVKSLQAAAALYRGDLLADFYDDWLLPDRYRLETLFEQVLAELMVAHEGRAEYGAQLAAAQRLLSRNPLREDAHRATMRAYCYLGQRTAALEQYRRCQQVLMAELDAEPAAETFELYQEVLDGRFEMGPAPGVFAVEELVPVPPPGRGRNPLDASAPGAMVGREEELAFLEGCWQGADTGQGSLVFISGEAGVGKTRLVEELAHRGRRRGERVLWGRCYEFERTLPYQPISEALRSVLPLLAPAELGDLPDWALAEVARLVPELAETRPNLQLASAPEAGQQQPRLFESIARFLIGLASRGVLLVVIEDLHWASESTLQLVHYLARHVAEQPVLMAATSRPEAADLQQPLLALRRRLTREGLAQSLQLSRLPPQAVERLVVEMSGAGEAVAPLAGRLYRETEGNPFFLMEILTALFAEGVIRLEGGRWQADYVRLSQADFPLPASMNAAIEGRVRGLSRDTREAVGLAAVLGREFDFELLDAAWSRGEETTLTALEELLRRRLIAEGTEAAGRDYVFTHHKIQEVVSAGLPRRRRQFLHGQVGATMERLFASDVGKAVGELAHHFEQARELDPGLTGKAVAYLQQAGDRARLAYAHREAIDYYERALALLKDQGDHERAARTLMKLGLTYHGAFDFRRSRQAYEEGSSLWQRIGHRTTGVSLPPAPHALRVVTGVPTSVDPTASAYLYSFCVMDQLFSGLVEYRPDLGIVPAAAHTWEISAGGHSYVFHLREDACWSDGTRVTAGDFAYAWRRMLDPATRAPYPAMLYDIRGARAFHRGEASDPDCVGLEVVDDLTLAVELEEPASHWLHLLAGMTYPVPRHIVEAHGEAWTEVDHLVGNGPFKMQSWQRGHSIVLVRNPRYTGRFSGNVQQVELHALEQHEALAEYEAGKLDVLDLEFLAAPLVDSARQRHAGEYLSVPCLMTLFVAFDVSQPPFDDLRVRRAFALATDRETLAEVDMRGFVFPATGGVLPPGLPGHSPGIAVPCDPQEARRLLAQAGYPEGRGFPMIDAVTIPEFEAVSRHLQARWRETLGLETTWQTVDIEAFFAVLHRGRQVPLALLRWRADYPDPASFLSTLPHQRITGWQNRAYAEFIKRARQVLDQGTRIELYKQADRNLVEEASILPLYYGRWQMLVKPWVRRFPTSPINYWFWKDVIIEPH